MASTTKGDGFRVRALRATSIVLGSTSASSSQEKIKTVTGIADTVPTAVFAVTVPNAQHTAFMEIDALGIMGAGGVVGAGETSKLAKYQLVVTRTAGLLAVVTVSAIIGGVESKVAGASSITSVVVTASAVTGANSATQTFNVMVAITKAAGGASAHVCIASARMHNQNANGITFA